MLIFQWKGSHPDWFIVELKIMMILVKMLMDSFERLMNSLCAFLMNYKGLWVAYQNKQNLFHLNMFHLHHSSSSHFLFTGSSLCLSSVYFLNISHAFWYITLSVTIIWTSWGFSMKSKATAAVSINGQPLPAGMLELLYKKTKLSNSLGYDRTTQTATAASHLPLRFFTLQGGRPHSGALVLLGAQQHSEQNKKYSEEMRNLASIS